MSSADLIPTEVQALINAATGHLIRHDEQQSGAQLSEAEYQALRKGRDKLKTALDNRPAS